MFYNSQTSLPFKNLDKGQLFIIVVSNVVLCFQVLYNKQLLTQFMLVKNKICNQFGNVIYSDFTNAIFNNNKPVLLIRR